jgi:hypothetical protein
MKIGVTRLGLWTALLLTACDGGTAGTGGGGGTAGGGGAAGTAGSGGAVTTSTCEACPAGSHPGADCVCESSLVEWMVGPQLTSARDHHVTFLAETAAGTFLYAAAGASSSGLALTSVERAAVAEDGSLGAFEAIEPLPAGLVGPGLAQVESTIVIGGGLENTGNSTAETWLGAVGADGHIAYTAGPPLTAHRYHVTLVAAKGFVLAIGGLQQTLMGGTPVQSILDVVERASFDGTTLSAFEAIGALPTKLTHHSAFFHGDAVYVLGGGSSAAATTDILRATFSDTGDLGPWEVVGQLPEARATASTSVLLDQLHVFAGMQSLTGQERDTVLRAPLSADGLVGTFTDLPPLPKARAHCHQTPLHNGFFYSVGGSINHVPQKDVLIGRLE